MTKSPNPPAWAAKVWFEDGNLHLDLPMAEGVAHHRLTFPCDMQGMIRLRNLLQQRNVHSMIGEPGDLTQHQVNKQLKQKLLKEEMETAEADYILSGGRIGRKPKPKFAPEARAAARDVLRKLGLIGAVRR